jgi:hypothetical protein
MFDTKDFAMVGELLEGVRTDGKLREAVIASQRERLEAFSPASVRSQLELALDRVRGGAQ